MKKIKPKKKLTMKQRRFVKSYIETGNATKSAKKAGYKGNQVTLGAVGGENLKKPIIKETIREVQERMGITDELLATKLQEGLNAEKTTYFPQGDSTKQLNSVDYPTRHRYIETAHKLRGEFAPQEIKLESDDIKKLTEQIKIIAERD